MAADAAAALSALDEGHVEAEMPPNSEAEVPPVLEEESDGELGLIRVFRWASLWLLPPHRIVVSLLLSASELRRVGALPNDEWQAFLASGGRHPGAPNLGQPARV